MRVMALLVAVMVVVSVNAAEVYKTTDAAGNVIYSDTPSPDAETITIPETQTVPADTAPPFEYTPPAPGVQPYTKLSIVSPANDEALRPDADSVQVVARAEPAFRGQDSYVLTLDGKEHSSGKSASFPLASLERGSHTVSVAIRDPSGTVLISSDPITFHVLRNTIVKNKNPPGGKPPAPKPPTPPKSPKSP